MPPGPRRASPNGLGPEDSACGGRFQACPGKSPVHGRLARDPIWIQIFPLGVVLGETLTCAEGQVQFLDNRSRFRILLQQLERSALGNQVMVVTEPWPSENHNVDCGTKKA